MDELNKIMFRMEDTNEEIEFSILDQCEYKNKKYILVVESEEEDDDNALILKEKTEDGDDIIYDLIEDEEEYLAVLELFRANNDDFDLDYDD